MNEFLTQVQTYINQSHSDWANSVLFITIASFLAWVAWRIIHNRLEILVQKTPFHWDDLLLAALKTPVSTLLWCWPATVSIGLILQDQFGNEINWLKTLKHILIICTFVWFTLRMITNTETYVLEQKNRDETTVQAIAKVARLFFMVMGGLTIMQAFGLSLSGLLTFGGVGGLIVGLAAKDLLSNFFGGMMIYFDRPFKVGNWIRSPDRQIEGIRSESALYNIGGVERNFNTPTYALLFLRASHKLRFEFEGATDLSLPLGLDGPSATGEIYVLRFRETWPRTIIRGRDGRNMPAEGRFWIESESGRVLATEINVEDQRLKATIAVTFEQDDTLDHLVPSEMRERYDNREEVSRVDGTATYSRFRQFSVEVTESR